MSDRPLHPGRLLAALLMHQPLLSKQDLAIRFQVTARTIERWAASGELPRPWRIAGPRWTPEQIQAWEAKRRAA